MIINKLGKIATILWSVEVIVLAIAAFLQKQEGSNHRLDKLVTVGEVIQRLKSFQFTFQQNIKQFVRVYQALCILLSWRKNQLEGVSD